MKMHIMILSDIRPAALAINHSHDGAHWAGGQPTGQQPQQLLAIGSPKRRSEVIPVDDLGCKNRDMTFPTGTTPFAGRFRSMVACLGQHWVVSSGLGQSDRSTLKQRRNDV
ncbi:hypothetical protein E4U54_001937 [Claviceps lovelessii]|nr:hypothetical protein E4U54_001937 [Claviceps lovelessii]